MSTTGAGFGRLGYSSWAAVYYETLRYTDCEAVKQSGVYPNPRTGPWSQEWKVVLVEGGL
jgi:hypothetical protein